MTHSPLSVFEMTHAGEGAPPLEEGSETPAEGMKADINPNFTTPPIFPSFLLVMIERSDSEAPETTIPLQECPITITPLPASAAVRMAVRKEWMSGSREVMAGVWVCMC